MMPKYLYPKEPSQHYYRALKKAKKRLGLISRLCQFIAKFFRNSSTLFGHAVRRMLYKTSMAKCGKRLTVHMYAIIKHAQMIRTGDDCVINPFCFLNALQGINIGNDVQISPHCSMISHVIQNERAQSLGFGNIIDQTRLRPIEIGDHSWIASYCLIGPGVKIGKNCQIGANSVVLTDVPDNCFAAGTPAKIIKKFRR